MYLAVLPRYRSACMEQVRNMLDGDLTVVVSQAHLDQSVTTDPTQQWYGKARMRRLLGQRIFIQTGFFRAANAAETLVVDLNPRSLTAWTLLFVRYLPQRRRTLVWGHLNPQRGELAGTAWLRRLMRRMSDGTITYTYTDATRAVADLPDSKVWVAPNALYRADAIQPAIAKDDNDRVHLIYVGRFEPAKKVRLALAAFQRLATSSDEGLRLLLIGAGTQEADLRQFAQDLGILDLVRFIPPVTAPRELGKYYAQSFAAMSPGFAGLGLTQALGFGVPMVIARNEPHSPEIELATDSWTYWFEADNPADMERAVRAAWADRARLPLVKASAHVHDHYSADAMALGLVSALRNERTWDAG